MDIIIGTCFLYPERMFVASESTGLTGLPKGQSAGRTKLQKKIQTAAGSRLSLIKLVPAR